MDIDRIYSRDDLFEERLHALQAFIEKGLAEECEWVLVFGCHPVQVMALEWLEHHALVSGKSRTPQELGWHYGVKPREEEARARYDRYEQLAVPSVPRYPGTASEIDAWIRQPIGEHWALPLNFSCEAMAEHARLQTWTMEPAWRRPPQGPVTGRDYAARCFLK